MANKIETNSKNFKPSINLNHNRYLDLTTIHHHLNVQLLNNSWKQKNKDNNNKQKTSFQTLD